MRWLTYNLDYSKYPNLPKLFIIGAVTLGLLHKDANTGKPWNIIHILPWYFLCALRPPSSSVKWTWKVLALLTNERILECNGHGPSILCEVGLSATSHMSQEPRPWNCESSKEVSKDHLKTLPESCSVVKSPQVYCEVTYDRDLNQVLMQWISIHVGSSHMIKYNKPTIVRFQSAMVFQFRVRPTSRGWFLKTVQVTMKHDPLDAM